MQSREPQISTVLLNWNRADLLGRTLKSYLETVSVPFELIVVDNASTDDSRDVIQEYAKGHPEIQTIFLKENEGGAALNHGVNKASAPLIHLSENDLEYLPGWDRYALEMFEAFPKLGQLSVFGPVPTDQEAWELHPCGLLHESGRIIYESFDNVGTSSILRRQIFDSGVRLENIGENSVKFPNDGKLSDQVKQSGQIVAWASHYQVRNLGHEGPEMEGRPDYYDASYKGKPWLGVEGKDRRLKEWHDRVRPSRESSLFPGERISPEKSAATDECPEPQLWTMLDGWTAEVETLEFIYSLVRLTKPRYVLETGTWLGAGAVAIGKALRDNGSGKLVTLEIDHGSCEFAKRRITGAGLGQLVQVLEMPSLEFMPDEPIDFIFLDSALEIRGIEFRHFLPRLVPGAVVIFHDTAKHHKVVGEAVQGLLQQGYITGFFLKTPRGIMVAQYTGKR